MTTIFLTLKNDQMSWKNEFETINIDAEKKLVYSSKFDSKICKCQKIFY